ncbi:MAG: tetratricopeptide repeat protein [Gemmatimonadales bacterium]|jgi:tetratricopeptide (TPR) repeat protein
MSPDNDLEREILQLEQRYAENAHGLVFAHLADAYRRAGEYSKAEGLLLHGLKTHSTYTSAYNVLGRVYLDSERFAEAHDQFARALELDPQNLISLRALGDLAARRGLVDDARVWYERILQIDPRSEEARDGLARLTTADAEPPPPAAAEGEGSTLAPEPAPPAEEPRAVEEAAPARESAPTHDVPMPPELGEPSLETVEKIEAEIERVEGLIGDEEMSGFTLESISAESAAPETPPESDEDKAEPWALDAEPEAAASDSGAFPEGAEAEVFEPWSEGLAEPEEESVEPAAETESERGFETPPVAETESLELPSMDDWSPGFVVGELLEGQAVEDLRPEEILDGLDAEISFDAAEEATGEESEAAGKPVERRGEGVVTETMAELYASQGLYSDALAVYRHLAETRPEDERLQARILDLEQRLQDVESMQDAEQQDLVRLMRLTEPVVEEPASGTESLETIEAEPEAGDFEFESLETTTAEPEEAVDFEFESLGITAEPEAGDVELEGMETAAEPEAEGLEFENEAPVAGFEQLDPFASSFDALAGKTQPDEMMLTEEPPPAVDEPRTEEAEPAEPLELEWADVEAVPVESLAEELEAEEAATPLESPEGEYAPFETLADESAAEVVAEEVTDEVDYSGPEEGITAVDNIWELTEVGASGVGESVPDQGSEAADEESEVPVRFVTRAESAESEQPATMEDYLGALLTFEIGSLFKRSATKDGSVVDDGPPADIGSSKAEDLDQFQEWLKSLKR